MSGFLTGFRPPGVSAVLASRALCYILTQRGRLRVDSPWGGGVGWAVCLLCAFTGSDILQYFAGSVAVAIYAEVMARVMKSPATGFLVVGVLPFVPGGGIYYTMEYCIAGDTQQFLTTGIHTFGVAGSVAVGILLVSSATRLLHPIKMAQDR